MDPTTITPRRDAWCAREFDGYSDMELSERSLFIDAHIMDMDSLDGWEFDDPRRATSVQALHATNYEMARRVRLGIFINHKGETFEERFTPFGPEWEREQMERMGA